MIWHTVFKDYLETRKAQAESVSALRQLSGVFAALAMCNALLSVGPRERINNSPIEDVPWWLDASVPGTDFPIWTILFGAMCVSVLLSVTVMHRVRAVLAVSGALWVIWGFTWIFGSILTVHQALFDSGLTAVFVGAAHFALARAWRAEGVD